MTSPKNELGRLVGLAAVVTGADQLTKFLITGWLATGEVYPVIPGFFHLVNWYNTGAAWGMFQNSNLVLAIISALALMAIVVFRRSLQLERPGHAPTVGLIAGGILGNLLDRLRVGHVIDFLDFQIAGHHWPAFNVADSAICVGVGLYVVLSWRADSAAPTARK